MKVWRSITMMRFIFILTSLILLLVVISCEPALTIKVDNHTDQRLIIYLDGHSIFNVEPTDTGQHRIQASSGYYIIEAKNFEGKIFYSKRYTWDELRDANYKILISISQNK